MRAADADECMDERREADAKPFRLLWHAKRYDDGLLHSEASFSVFANILQQSRSIA